MLACIAPASGAIALCAGLTLRSDTPFSDVLLRLPIIGGSFERFF